MAQKERERESARVVMSQTEKDSIILFYFFAGGVRIRVMLEEDVNTWTFMHTCMLD